MYNTGFSCHILITREFSQQIFGNLTITTFYEIQFFWSFIVPFVRTERQTPLCRRSQSIFIILRTCRRAIFSVMTDQGQHSRYSDKLQVGQPTNHGTISSRERESFFLQAVHAAYGAYHPPCQWLTRAVFSTVNWHVSDADHSLLYNAEKKVLVELYSTPLHAFMAFIRTTFFLHLTPIKSVQKKSRLSKFFPQFVLFLMLVKRLVCLVIDTGRRIQYQKVFG